MIPDDELKIREKNKSVMKQIEEYQNLIDEQDKLDKEKAAGDLQGKKVVRAPADSLGSLFKKAIDKN